MQESKNKKERKRKKFGKTERQAERTKDKKAIQI